MFYTPELENNKTFVFKIIYLFVLSAMDIHSREGHLLRQEHEAVFPFGILLGISEVGRQIEPIKEK